MSLDLHLTGDAQADIRQLDPRLQEEVLDELERLAAGPSLIPPPIPDWSSLHTFARPIGDRLCAVILILSLNPARTRLTVLGVRLLSED